MKQELILEIIKGRWSPYAFSSAEVEDFKLKAMFEAAGHAPSAFNEQPWSFVFATRKEGKIFDDFAGFLADQNRLWASNAYCLIISMARTNFTVSGKPNRFAFHDTGMAVSHLLLQAQALDLYVHQMAGYSVDKVKEYFSLDSDTEPVAMMAVGYLGDGHNLPDELLKRDENRRPRKPVNLYTFRRSAGNAAF
jgi:nitroreductase